MSMKKRMTSENFSVIKTNANNSDVFPVGFQYVLDGVVYTVSKDITDNPNAPMRRLTTSSGDTEDVAIHTIAADLKESGAEVLDDGKKEEKEEKDETQDDS